MFKEKWVPLWLNSTPQIYGKNRSYIITKAGYVIWTVQCKMKMQGSLLKNYEEFQGVDSSTLNQAWGRSKPRALCNCTGSTPLKPALWSLLLRPQWATIPATADAHSATMPLSYSVRKPKNSVFKLLKIATLTLIITTSNLYNPIGNLAHRKYLCVFPTKIHLLHNSVC